MYEFLTLDTEMWPCMTSQMASLHAHSWNNASLVFMSVKNIYRLSFLMYENETLTLCGDWDVALHDLPNDLVAWLLWEQCHSNPILLSFGKRHGIRLTQGIFVNQIEVEGKKNFLCSGQKNGVNGLQEFKSFIKRAKIEW